MLQPVAWILIIQVIGIATFPITFGIFKNLSDRGYAFSKPIGIAVIGLISWILSVNGLSNPSRLSLFVIMLFMVSVSIILTHKHWIEIKIFMKETWKLLVSLDLLFLCIYVMFIGFIYWDPSINHTEQPMDFAFLNASIMAEVGGPEDPWMKGSVISYYYFGYWIFGMLTIISGVIPEIAYNLSLASIPALTMVTVIGLVVTLLRNQSTPKVPSIIFAVTSGIATVFLSNLHGFIEFLRENAFGTTSFWKTLCIEGMTKVDIPTTQSWRPMEFWWWFKSTRIINHFGDTCEGKGLDYTITEFPFFSYILGDLHPHVTSTPFFVVFLGICLCIIHKRESRFLSLYNLSLISLLILIFSTVIFVNMWYLPLTVGILFGIYILKILMGPDKEITKNLITPFTIVATSMLLLSPYILTLQTSVSGVSTPTVQTKVAHALIIWLPLLILTIPYILIEFGKLKISTQWKTPILVASIVTFIPWGIKVLISSNGLDLYSVTAFTLFLTVMIFVAMLVATTISFKSGLTTRAVILYLSAIGLMLILVPELLYLQDIYNNRMNTVFKLYYQAWILLAICSGYILFYWYKLRIGISGSRKWLYGVWTLLIIFVTTTAMYYVPASLATKAAESPIKSLNGLMYLQQEDLDLKNAIDFARANISISDGILEGVSEWGSAGIISRSTGIPNPINWPGHQTQWRNQTDEIQQTISHVETIYTTNNANDAKNLLNRYDVKYVLVSPKEINQYGLNGMHKFNSLGQLVFGEEDGTRIYKIDD